jgi:hypothetical protein
MWSCNLLKKQLTDRNRLNALCEFEITDRVAPSTKNGNAKCTFVGVLGHFPRGCCLQTGLAGFAGRVGTHECECFAFKSQSCGSWRELRRRQRPHCDRPRLIASSSPIPAIARCDLTASAQSDALSLTPIFALRQLLALWQDTLQKADPASSMDREPRRDWPWPSTVAKTTTRDTRI